MTSPRTECLLSVQNELNDNSGSTLDCPGANPYAVADLLAPLAPSPPSPPPPSPPPSPPPPSPPPSPVLANETTDDLTDPLFSVNDALAGAFPRTPLSSALVVIVVGGVGASVAGSAAAAVAAGSPPTLGPIFPLMAILQRITLNDAVMSNLPEFAYNITMDLKWVAGVTEMTKSSAVEGNATCAGFNSVAKAVDGLLSTVALYLIAMGSVSASSAGCQSTRIGTHSPKPWLPQLACCSCNSPDVPHTCHTSWFQLCCLLVPYLPLHLASYTRVPPAGAHRPHALLAPHVPARKALRRQGRKRGATGR